MTYAPINAKSAYLATTEVFPKDNEQFLIKLTTKYTDIANAVNDREIAIYQASQQVLTGQVYSTPGDNQTKKYVFRTMFYIGAVPAGSTLTTAHGIAGLVQCTHMYGTCITATPNFKPIPFTDAALVTNQIALYADSTNFYVVVGATSPAITSGTVTLEYLLN